ncbi:hypothetical protein AGMMS49928_23360 [Spirochaetia bacterium]|nr:hypothetical protein AGMMS49928_23360 [Spirochaetia bacterium]
MDKKLTELNLENLLDYYVNFIEEPRITGMIAAAGRAAGLSAMALDDDQLDIAAAGDADQIRRQQFVPELPGQVENDK